MHGHYTVIRKHEHHHPLVRRERFAAAASVSEWNCMDFTDVTNTARVPPPLRFVRLNSTPSAT